MLPTISPQELFVIMSMLSSAFTFVTPILYHIIPFILCKCIGFIVIPEFRENADKWIDTTTAFLWKPSYHVDDGELKPSGIYIFRYTDEPLTLWSIGIAICEWKRTEGSDDETINPSIYYIGRKLDNKILVNNSDSSDLDKQLEMKTQTLSTLERGNNKIWSGYRDRSYELPCFDNIRTHQTAIADAIKSRANTLILGVGGSGKSTGIEYGCICDKIRMCRVNSLTSAFCDINELIQKSSNEKPICIVSEEFETIFSDISKGDRQSGGVRPSVETKSDLFTLLYDSDKVYANHSFVFTTNMTINQLKREMNRIDVTMFASFFRRFTNIITVGTEYRTTHSDIYNRSDLFHRIKSRLRISRQTNIDPTVFVNQTYQHFDYHGEPIVYTTTK